MKSTLVTLLLILLFSFVMANDDLGTDTNDTEETEEKLKFKLLFFREDCFNEFLKFNIFYKDCISITMSKGLGYGIILGASIVKIPQIINILKAKSARGILISMFYMEAYMHIINGCYNIHLGSPFSVYGENFCLLAQNILLMILIWYYGSGDSDERTCTRSKNIGRVMIMGIIFSSLLYLYLDTLVPVLLWKSLMNIQILMVAYSRLPQIVENFRTKSTGELSSLMFILNTLGNTARLFTFIKETNDVLNMCTSALSAVLNFTIFVQVLYYWKSTESYKNIKSKDEEAQTPALVQNNSDENEQEGQSRTRF